MQIFHGVAHLRGQSPAIPCLLLKPCRTAARRLACSGAPRGANAHFYRTAAGAEIDLLLTLPGGRQWAIEIKRSLAPKVEKGFHLACADLAPYRACVIYPGTERFALGAGVEAMGVIEAIAGLATDG